MGAPMTDSKSTPYSSLLGLSVLGALACSSSMPAREEPAGRAPLASPTPVATPPAVAPTAPPAPSADVEGSAAGPSCEPAERADVPALWQALFEKGRHFRYQVTDDVDPHAPGGGRAVTKTKVDCVVASLCRFHDGAVSSELACTSDPNADFALGSDKLRFLANASSLWMPATLPQDDASARKALGDPPILSASPAKSRRTYEQPGMHEGSHDACTEVVEVTSALVCRDVRCAVKVGYGPSQDRTCVSPTRGLASWRRVNLEGPRTTTWELLDSKPAAAR